MRCPERGQIVHLLLLDSGAHAHIGNKSHFSFELSWMRHDGFDEIVRREWMSIHSGNSPVERWQNKIRHLRQLLRGWAKNLSGQYKMLKDQLTLLIDQLHIKVESTPLSVAERAAKKDADDFCSQIKAG